MEQAEETDLEKTIIECQGSPPYFRHHQTRLDQVYVRDDGYRCGPCMALTMLQEGDISGFNKMMDKLNEVPKNDERNV